MKPARNRLLPWLIAVMIVGMFMPWHAIPAQANSTSAGTGPVYHVVKKGDTLAGIAKKYGVTLQALMSQNKLKNANKIYVGQKLRIPPKPVSATPPAPIVAAPIPTATPLPVILPTGRPNN